MICAAVPGRRYEIEVFPDGRVEAEVFGGGQPIGGEEVVRELLAKYPDGA